MTRSSQEKSAQTCRLPMPQPTRLQGRQSQPPVSLLPMWEQRIRGRPRRRAPRPPRRTVRSPAGKPGTQPLKLDGRPTDKETSGNAMALSEPQSAAPTGDQEAVLLAKAVPPAQLYRRRSPLRPPCEASGISSARSVSKWVESSLTRAMAVMTQEVSVPRVFARKTSCLTSRGD